MAGRGQVSWLPGLDRRTFPGNRCPPQWLTQSARDVLDPVTVAGPRRLLTGLPLTTDRIYVGESIRSPGRETVRPARIFESRKPASRDILLSITSQMFNKS
jgi:hypothetical protein